jgi:hypothetical protein
MLDTNMTTSELLQENADLLAKIEQLRSKISPLSDKRDMLFSSSFRNACSKFRTINSLIEKNLNSEAFSRIRSLFDTVVKTLCIYNQCDGIDLNDNVQKDRMKVTEKMCNKLDDTCEVKFFDMNRNKTFNDDNTVDALILCNQLLKHFSDVYFEEVGLKHGDITSDEIQEFHEKYLEYK